MNAFEAYETYLAVKAHFTQKTYDFHRYNGKVKTTVSAFESRRDKAFFYKLAKKYPLKRATDLYVANFIDNPNKWIGDLVSEEADEVYSEWRKRTETLTYCFSEECSGLLEWASVHSVKFNRLFTVTGDDHPVIVKMVLQHTISLETFIILDEILGFGERIDRRLSDIIWKELWLKASKYRSFINIEVERCKKILRTKLQMEYNDIL